MAKKRMSAAKKEALVLRLLRGEDLETVSREAGVPLHKLSDWRDAYSAAGREGLKAKPGDPVSIEPWSEKHEPRGSVNSNTHPGGFSVAST